MSRHFELMQRMEEKRSLSAEPAPPAQEILAQKMPAEANTQAATDMGPAIKTHEPIAATPEPAAIVYEPVVKASEPAASAYEPIARAAEPPVMAPEPIAHEPIARASEPAAPPVAPLPSTPPAQVDRRRWASAEALRLVQQIFLVPAKEPPRVVVFAGVDYGNGCNEVCASVAETLAKNIRGSVCLVEANFRSPGLQELFGSTRPDGVIEALLQQDPIRTFTGQLTPGNLSLLSWGSPTPDASSLLASSRFGERLRELRQEFDFVMVHASPLIRYSDAILLGQLSDGVVMVLSSDSTQREAAADAAASLRSSRVPILAAVLHKRT